MTGLRSRLAQLGTGAVGSLLKFAGLAAGVYLIDEAVSNEESMATLLSPEMATAAAVYTVGDLYERVTRLFERREDRSLLTAQLK